MADGDEDGQRAAFEAAVRRIRADSDPVSAFQAAGKLEALHHDEFWREAARLRAEQALRVWESEQMSYDDLGIRLGVTKQRAHQLVAIAREAAAEKSARPEPAQVVAAIVTSRKGVLVTRRKDGRPPWGFVTGEIEPGESPADAAVREVKEETGLEVRKGQVIGRRVHPVTDRTVIYMAAEPVRRSTEIFVGDESELAEVAWVTLAEALGKMPDMHEPVKAYLARMLRRKAGT